MANTSTHSMTLSRPYYVSTLSVPKNDGTTGPRTTFQLRDANNNHVNIGNALIPVCLLNISPTSLPSKLQPFVLSGQSASSSSNDKLVVHVAIYSDGTIDALVSGLYNQSTERRMTYLHQYVQVIGMAMAGYLNLPFRSEDTSTLGGLSVFGRTQQSKAAAEAARMINVGKMFIDKLSVGTFGAPSADYEYPVRTTLEPGPMTALKVIVMVPSYSLSQASSARSSHPPTGWGSWGPVISTPFPSVKNTPAQNATNYNSALALAISYKFIIMYKH